MPTYIWDSRNSEGDRKDSFSIVWNYHSLEHRSGKTNSGDNKGCWHVIDFVNYTREGRGVSLREEW